MRSAFRIIKSWSRWEGNDPRNFYITVEALARRLGISVRGAGKLRRRFCQPLGILKKISDYIPQKKSACFAWLLQDSLPPIAAEAIAMFDGCASAVIANEK